MRRLGVSLLALALLLLQAPTAHAQELRLHEPILLRASTVAGDGRNVQEFLVSFALASAGRAYVSALPRPGNSACTGCDGNSTGWETDILFGEDERALGRLIKDRPVTLGDLPADVVHVLRLRVTAPPQALAKASNHSLDYVLAYHPPQTSSQSGGSLDPSQALHAMWQVEAATQQQSVAQPQEDRPSPMAILALALLLLPMVGAAALLVHKRRRPPEAR